MQLSLNLIGGFALKGDGGAMLKISLTKAKAIISFLALAAGGAASRNELISVWWSDRQRVQANQSLRQTMLAMKHDLARAGVPRLVRVERNQICLDLSQIRVDALVLSGLARSDSPLSSEDALNLPVGGFLQGVVTRDPVGDAWIQDRSTEFFRLRLVLLKKTLQTALSADEMDAVEMLARRILAINPAVEVAHQALICAFLARGERSLAVRQGQLQRGVSPSGPVGPAVTTTSSSRHAEASSGALGTIMGGVQSQAAPKPGLLVMPFARADAAPATARLAFGLTDDLVVDLSRLSLVSILPPGTTSSLGLDQVGLLDAARHLGVDYCLTGSIETRSNDAKARFRLNALLSDATSGRVLWAKRYDRSDGDIWTVRTELSARIAGTASHAVDMAEMARIHETGTRNRDAWALRVMAQRNFLLYTRTANARARALFTQAIKLDPGFTMAETGLGWTHLEDHCFGWTQFPVNSLDAAEAYARRSLQKDPYFYSALHLLSYVELCRREYGKAAEICAKARDDNPENPDLLFHDGYVTSCAGAPKEGVDTIMQAFAINPLHPKWYHLLAGSAALDAERNRTAILELTRFLDTQQGPIIGVKAQALRTRAAAHALAGNMDQAIADRQVYMSVNRQFSVQVFRRTFPRQHRSVVERQADALRAAGFPE